MKITLHVPKSRSRSHRVLFDRELPFRPKSERRRDLYQRRVKNQRQRQESWD
jgi:hypothetical protein